eukprot:9484816-Pyramimonas_sp.AAC.1
MKRKLEGRGYSNIGDDSWVYTGPPPPPPPRPPPAKFLTIDDGHIALSDAAEFAMKSAALH